MTELGKNKTIDSLKYSYRCPNCDSEGAFTNFANWRTEDLGNGLCARCAFEGTISEFRKPTREILALARGRLLGAIEALSLGLGAAGTLIREMKVVFDPEGNAIDERAKTRESSHWGTDTLDRLDVLAGLIKAQLQDLED